MGYYTTYNLRVKPRKEVMDEKLVEIARAFNEMLGYEYFDDYEIDYIKEHNFIDITFEAKWYSSNGEMQIFSAKFPEYSFFMEGRGEDPNDWWAQYYKNGVCSQKYKALPPKEVASQNIEESFTKND